MTQCCIVLSLAGCLTMSGKRKGHRGAFPSHGAPSQCSICAPALSLVESTKSKERRSRSPDRRTLPHLSQPGSGAKGLVRSRLSFLVAHGLACCCSSSPQRSLCEAHQFSQQSFSCRFCCSTPCPNFFFASGRLSHLRHFRFVSLSAPILTDRIPPFRFLPLADPRRLSVRCARPAGGRTLRENLPLLDNFAWDDDRLLRYTACGSHRN